MREAQIVYTIFAAPWPSAFGDQQVAGVGVSVDGTAIDVIEGHEGSIVPGGRVSWRHFYDQLPPILVDHRSGAPP